MNMEKMNYKAYTLRNFREIPQMKHMSEEELFNIEVVGNVLPLLPPLLCAVAVLLQSLSHFLDGDRSKLAILAADLANALTNWLPAVWALAVLDRLPRR